MFLIPILLLGSGFALANQAMREERTAEAQAEALTREVEAARSKERIAAMILTSLVFALPISISALREIMTTNRQTSAAPSVRPTVARSGALVVHQA